MPLIPDDYRYSVNNLEFMRRDSAEKRFKQVTRSALPLFLRGGDTITITPSVAGFHEDDVESVIRWAARNGHGDFLIDIGANIGLTSCLVGDCFSAVRCYEPNPLAFAILGVNTKIGIAPGVDVRLFNYGIGNENSTTELLVPKSNWGGAFVVQGNSYDQETLLRKDGFRNFDEGNYIRQTVEIRTAESSLAQVFDEFRAQGKRSGVIKIDAEGFELSILEAVSGIVPADFGLVIVFENHMRDVTREQLVSLFRSRADLFLLDTRKVRGATLVRYVRSILGAKRESRLRPVDEYLGKGNFVMIVRAQS